MKLTYVRLLVADMSASYRFYRHALGLATTQEENRGYVHDIEWVRE